MRFEPGRRIDHFEIVEALGEGAYAESYKARDTEDGHLVVLKVPNPTLFADPQLFQRYRREADVVARLDHPNVTRSLDNGEHRTEPYLVLEYVDGENLRQRVAELGGRVPIETAIAWGRQLADALAYLHEHGVVHRDLKPENVLVTPEGSLRIMDFGTALLEGARRLTWRHLSESLGTPDYMSPEQIQGGRGDARSDVYSWGVLMYELLTGSPPFRGDNWLAAMAGHLQKTPASIRSTRPDVPPALEAVVMTAMRRYPEHRYQSARDIVRDLDHLDEIDPSAYDLSPEAPMGGIGVVDSTRRLWALVAIIAVSFLGIVAIIITVSVVAR
ncbi:MAG: serine/threonine protein kinase [Actinobacteria bacterium]|nr:serine/threonine protein kinase [Actinomycetota bacterium]